MSGWDTNWDSTEAVGKLPRNTLTQLWAALNERLAVAHASDPLLTEPVAGRLPGAAWYTRFQARMTDAINAHANHQTSGGDYDGLPSVPNWNEPDILAAIGDAGRIAAPSAGKLVAAWAWQQHQMLNLLRWYPVGNCDYADAYKREGADAAAWDAASWVASESASYGAMSHYNPSTPIYVNYVLKYTSKVAGVEMIPAPYQPSGVLYFRPDRIGTDYWTDMGWAEDVLNHVEDIAAGSSLTSAEIGNRARCALDGATSGGYQRYALSQGVVMLLKYDGEHGYVYRDW
jgi:hypothetical protein